MKANQVKCLTFAAKKMVNLSNRSHTVWPFMQTDLQRSFCKIETTFGHFVMLKTVQSKMKFYETVNPQSVLGCVIDY